jgi:hypothetical protein
MFLQFLPQRRASYNEGKYKKERESKITLYAETAETAETLSSPRKSLILIGFSSDNSISRNSAETSSDFAETTLPTPMLPADTR